MAFTRKGVTDAVDDERDSYKEQAAKAEELQAELEGLCSFCGSGPAGCDRAGEPASC